MLWLSLCVCVCVYREAVRTRAFLSSDGRIALLRPRRTDSVRESWKETHRMLSKGNGFITLYNVVSLSPSSCVCHFFVKRTWELKLCSKM